MKDVTKSFGAKPGMTFPAMRAKAQAGSLAKGQYAAGSCAGATQHPTGRNAGQGTGIVQKTPINSSRSGNDPMTKQSVPLKP